VLSSLICFIGSLEMLLYGVMFIQSFLFEEWLPFALITIAMTVLMISNLYFYVTLQRETTKDVFYLKWQRLFP